MLATRQSHALVSTEQHFSEFEGGIYGPSPFDTRFWSDYLSVFGSVVVVSRVRKVRHAPSDSCRQDDQGLSFARLPDYRGPWQFLLTLPVLLWRTFRCTARASACILRVPGAVGTLVWLWCVVLGKRFAVEVVGDPDQSLRHTRSAVSGIARASFVWALRRQCRTAAASSYVTSAYLQERYPPGKLAPTYAISSIRLAAEAFGKPRVGFSSKTRIITVGVLHPYKGHRALLEALRICRANGLEFETLVVGDGDERSALEEKAERLGIADRVSFVGWVADRAGLLRLLDDSDVFVLPSLTEGLPRALIEAMARGLPAIASDVGGVPELLGKNERVPPGDPEALARKICRVAAEPERMVRMSSRNLEKAREYCAGILRRRRASFYRYVAQGS